MKLEGKWENKTSGGLPVVLYTDKVDHPCWTIHGAVKPISNDWRIHEWCKDGTSPINKSFDLVKKQEKRLVYLYRNGLDIFTSTNNEGWGDPIGSAYIHEGIFGANDTMPF